MPKQAHVHAKARYRTVPGEGRVAYSVFGAGPRKVIFLHGHPGSRHQALLIEPHLRGAGVELASLDRPGFGGSSPRGPGRPPLDLSGAVGAVADGLGWKRFHILAVSGGVPYALRSACELGERIASLQGICGLGPLRERAFRRRFPLPLLLGMHLGARLPLPLLGGIASSGLFPRLLSGEGARRPLFLSPDDFALLQSPLVSAVLRASFKAAFRQGALGARADLRAYLSRWDLDYTKLRCPVSFWHGKDDRLVPWEFSRLLTGRIPGARLFTLDGEGHYTLPVRRAPEILRAIGDFPL